MDIGDTLTDGSGGTWTVEALMGRGSMARSFLVRDDAGNHAVLRVPLSPGDFPDAPDAPSLVDASTAALNEQKAMMATRSRPFLPTMLGKVSLEDGREAVVMPRYGSSLEERLRKGESLSDVVDLLVRVMHQLANSVDGGAIHGNLRPTNIFLDDDGNPVLADPLTRSAWAARKQLEAFAHGRVDYRPPEADGEPIGGWDTWAACQIAYRAASEETSSDDPAVGAFVRPPREGLGKIALAAVKDAADGRLRAEAANNRFAVRATKKLGAVLNRGLSLQTDPSPPYRFDRAADLLPRLVEVDDLIHPAVESVSAILLGADAANGVYQGGEPVEFSVNVGTTAGVTAHEDLACGVNLRDLDAPGDGRIRTAGSRFTVKRYPSGRWRFNFVLPDVAPGRYKSRIAFVVNGSNDAPMVAEGKFQVRPRPGYVPPDDSEDRPSAPIPLPTRNEPRDDSAPVHSGAPAPVISLVAPRIPGIQPSADLEPSADYAPSPIADTASTATVDAPTYEPEPFFATPHESTQPHVGAVDVAGPPTLPSVEPAPLVEPTLEAPQPTAGPMDYPPLPPQVGAGIDLPSFDQEPSLGRGWMEKVRDMFAGDDMTPVFFAGASAFIVFAVLFALISSC